jgi:hypothetical protein
MMRRSVATGFFFGAAAAMLALLVLAGCPSPELGEAPFFCHNGTPPCPEGYTCEKVGGEDVCIREGSTPPKLDGSAGTDGIADKGPKEDFFPWVPDGPPTKLDSSTPQPGKVVITEFMADPDAVLDNVGEWIELFNMGDFPVDINGWTVKDNGTESFKITFSAPLEVPPKGYLLLGREKDKAKNGGVNVVYAYNDFYIANSEDEIFLIDTSGQTVDGFSYSKAAGFTIPTGASLSVKNPGADKNKPSSWCTETTPWPGSKGDKGTPGFNPSCK